MILGLFLIILFGSVFLYWIAEKQQRDSQTDQIIRDLNNLKANTQVYVRQLLVLDGQNNGWIMNAMHSREGCYTYVKEIVKAESYVELAEEEAEALDKAIFSDVYEKQ